MYDPMQDSQHGRLAQNVLDKVALELQERYLPVIRDNWPFHVVTTDLGLFVSLYCGRFDKRIDVAVLRKASQDDYRRVDLRYKERPFMTPKGAVNYVSRFFERKSR